MKGASAIKLSIPVLVGSTSFQLASEFVLLQYASICLTYVKYLSFNDITIAGLRNSTGETNKVFFPWTSSSVNHSVMWWKMGSQTGVRRFVLRLVRWNMLKPSRRQQFSEIIFSSKDGTYMHNLNTINNHDQTISTTVHVLYYHQLVLCNLSTITTKSINAKKTTNTPPTNEGARNPAKMLMTRGCCIWHFYGLGLTIWPKSSIVASGWALQSDSNSWPSGKSSWRLRSFTFNSWVQHGATWCNPQASAQP